MLQPLPSYTQIEIALLVTPQIRLYTEKELLARIRFICEMTIREGITHLTENDIRRMSRAPGKIEEVYRAKVPANLIKKK